MTNYIILTCLPRAFNLGSYQFIRPYSTTNNSISKPVAQIKIYGNADTMRLNILKENKGKAGIYQWVNHTSRRACVGSSINLYKRFQTHYSIDYLMKTRSKNTKINRAFFKYGRFHIQTFLYISLNIVI